MGFLSLLYAIALLASLALRIRMTEN